LWQCLEEERFGVGAGEALQEGLKGGALVQLAQEGRNR
jgi:hypothetical protein